MQLHREMGGKNLSRGIKPPHPKEAGEAVKLGKEPKAWPPKEELEKKILSMETNCTSNNPRIITSNDLHYWFLKYKHFFSYF